MVRCYICDKNYFNLQLTSRLIRNLDNQNQINELAILHRKRFGNDELLINQETRICFPCSQRIQNVLDAENIPTAIPMEVVVVKRGCFVCQHPTNNRLGIKARVHFYIKSGAYLPDTTRCCQQHLLSSGLILHQNIDFIKIPTKVAMSGEAVLSWFENLRFFSERNSFEDESDFEDEDFRALTSINKIQFNDLFETCTPVLLYEKERNVKKKDLLAFLMKLRQDLSDAFLKVILNYPSRQSVSLSISVVRESLKQQFVPNNLGLHSVEAINRDRFLIRHITDFANRLYNPQPEIRKAILYTDCTYIKIEKSSNFATQRESFSVQKKYNLVKVGLIVAPDGYILETYGPYFSDGRNNDAAILQNEMNDEGHDLRQWCQDGDVLVVDRGYRDAIEFIENLGLNCEMPPFLPRNQRQFTTHEANLARKITKTRWIIESRNGHLKSIFHFFKNTVSIKQLDHLGDYLRIALSIINKFFTPILMQDGTIETAEAMLNIINVHVNNLQQRVEQENLINPFIGGEWVNLDENNLNFPRLTFPYLRSKSFGTYTVKLAPGYIQDTASRQRNNEFIFQVQQLEENLIRAKICSRFTNATKHVLFIEYNENNIDDLITGTYCTCKTGARTLGTCAHVSSVLWYLGYARFENNVHYPPTDLLNIIADAANRNRQA